MAISVVQSAHHADVGAVSTVAPASAVTSGNLLVVCVLHFGASGPGTVSSITDSAGNTYTQVPSAAAGPAGAVGSSSGYQTDIWYCQNCIGYPNTTVTTTTVSYSALRLHSFLYEISGAKTSGVVDAANTLIGTTGPQLSPTITPSVVGELLLTIMGTNDDGPATTVSSPWVLDQPQPADSMASAHTINAPLSSQQASFTPGTTSNYASSVASFLPVASAPSASQWSTELVF
jgi:hypothetical protein